MGVLRNVWVYWPGAPTVWKGTNFLEDFRRCCQFLPKLFQKTFIFQNLAKRKKCQCIAKRMSELRKEWVYCKKYEWIAGKGGYNGTLVVVKFEYYPNKPLPSNQRHVLRKVWVYCARYECTAKGMGVLRNVWVYCEKTYVRIAKSMSVISEGTHKTPMLNSIINKGMRLIE